MASHRACASSSLLTFPALPPLALNPPRCILPRKDSLPPPPPPLAWLWAPLPPEPAWRTNQGERRVNKLERKGVQPERPGGGEEHSRWVRGEGQRLPGVLPAAGLLPGTPTLQVCMFSPGTGVRKVAGPTLPACL